MSRWKSPQVAAKRAMLGAKAAEKLRKQKRITRLLVLAFAAVSIGLVVADIFFLRYVARAARTHASASPGWYKQTATGHECSAVAITA